MGAFGGQTLLAYQTTKDEKTNIETKDIHWRAGSTRLLQNFKLLGGRSDHHPLSKGPDQRLDKLTIAPTLSVGPDFYPGRPGVRFT